jgi:hypothetical protein
MKYWKSLLVIETVFYVLAAYCLEYFIAFPYMAFHHGKDGGLTSEISFLLLITFISCLLWYRMHLLLLLSTLFISPIVIAISYVLCAYFMPKEESLVFLLVYLFLLTLSKWLCISRTRTKH